VEIGVCDGEEGSEGGGDETWYARFILAEKMDAECD
jgi:hypothetical protein